MDQVSYRQRDWQDEVAVTDFLTTARVGVLGLHGAEYPYAVPVNYVFRNGSVYFHGMGSGKKLDLLAAHPKVCFTVFQEHATVPDPVPCHADTAYSSVMIFGAAEKVTDMPEAAEALQAILDKYLPGHYRQTIGARLVERYRSSLDDNAVAVHRIRTVALTAKRNTDPGTADPAVGDAAAVDPASVETTPVAIEDLS